MSEIVLSTDLEEGISLFKKGKVRDIYDLGSQLLMIATDRISAFDVVLPDGIPYKGQVLTGFSAFWFDETADVCPNHFITVDINQFPIELQGYDWLAGRSMLVQKVASIPVECVVRGYLAGSGWQDYQKTGSVCGIKLPGGLIESQELPHAIFTPATKALSGHDENINFEQMVAVIDKWRKIRVKKGLLDIYNSSERLAEIIREESFWLFDTAALQAFGQGIIIADTKFEFGVSTDGSLLVIDEVFTPDSSRFWPLDDYEPGHSQKSFDKQYVRDYLEAVGWNKKSPAPQLPKAVIKNTSKKYLEAYQRIVGKPLV